MKKLFDQPLADDDPFAIAFADICSNGDEASRAIVTNFQCDHRVTKNRKQAWFDACHEAWLDFPAAVREYYREKIQELPKPDFLEPHNEPNFLYGSTSPNLLPPTLELVSCLDLTGLHEVLKYSAFVAGNKYFNDAADPYPFTFDLGTIANWHGRRIPSSTASVAVDHVSEVIKALSAFIAAGHRYHPTWATPWDRFRKLASPDDPNGWGALLGVRRCLDENHWLVLIRYRVQDAGVVSWPTVLDAGYYAFHFPSPAGATPAVGGHLMPLRFIRPHPLSSEFIHAQFPFSPSYFCKKWGVRRTTGEKCPDINVLRLRQLNALHDQYPTATTWLTDPDCRNHV